MRIVGGSLRGRRLAAPTVRGLRPTSARVRAALFNILDHGPAPPAGGRVLDAFAGTGALGFEALSRGAVHATFFDTDRRALRAMRATAAALGLGDATDVRQADATAPPPAHRPCDLVFLDPPYGDDVTAAAVAALGAAGWLAAGATIVVEARRRAPPAPPAGFAVRDTRRYGGTALHFVRAT